LEPTREAAGPGAPLVAARDNAVAESPAGGALQVDEPEGLDLRALAKLVGRHWLAVFLVLVLTGAAVTAVVRAVEPIHRASGSLLLLGPNQRAVPLTEEEGAPSTAPFHNPYTGFDRSLDTTAVVLAGVLSHDAVLDRLRAGDLSDDISVEVAQGGPILAVDAEDPDASRAIATVEALFAAASQELDRRQEAVGAPSELRIRTEVLTTPDRAERLNVDRNRAIAAMVVLGLAAAVGTAMVVDRFARWRRRRAEGRALAAT
jgi:hypothetical protein